MDIFNNLEKDADEKDSVIQRLLLTESLMIEQLSCDYTSCKVAELYKGVNVFSFLRNKKTG